MFGRGEYMYNNPIVESSSNASNINGAFITNQDKQIEHIQLHVVSPSFRKLYCTGKCVLERVTERGDGIVLFCAVRERLPLEFKNRSCCIIG